MSLQLSWDLFILVFFAVVGAYSFIIGRNQTLKVITATYISILCADALGNIFAKYFVNSGGFLRFLRFFSVADELQAVAFVKVAVFIVLIVIIAVKGLFDFDAEDDRPFSMKMGIVLVLAVLSGGLMISALLTFVSGGSFITALAYPNNPLTEIYTQSRLVRIMLDYSGFWFLMPGLAVMLLSILHRRSG